MTSDCATDPDTDVARPDLRLLVPAIAAVIILFLPDGLGSLLRRRKREGERA